MKFRTGVVIGKFLPPHRGHKFLIDTAASQVKNLTVIVCEKPTDPIPGTLRAGWMRQIHQAQPHVTVRVFDDRDYDDSDSQLWARLTTQFLGTTPDVAFTSEHYGEAWTRFMGSQHICVDIERISVPISATKIRQSPLKYWDFLEPPVRAYFACRVCVLGAESTGSTTLAQALANHYQTIWVAEYGREYCELHWTGFDYAWRSEEFTHIAQEQQRREDAAARKCNGLLICDTNAFATRLWHERYMGYFSPDVDAIAAQGRYDLYLLTGDEIPFIQDGLRDGEQIRHAMQKRFVAELNSQTVPWILLEGSPEKRLSDAVKYVDELLGN